MRGIILIISILLVGALGAGVYIIMGGRQQAPVRQYVERTKPKAIRVNPATNT